MTAPRIALTPAQLSRALPLYRYYRCETAEYRALAAEIGCSIADLNLAVWHVERARIERERAEEQRRAQERRAHRA